MCVCVYVFIYVFIYVYLCVCVCVCVCVCTCMSTHPHTHTDRHTHTYVYTIYRSTQLPKKETKVVTNLAHDDFNSALQFMAEAPDGDPRLIHNAIHDLDKGVVEKVCVCVCVCVCM